MSDMSASVSRTGLLAVTLATTVVPNSVCKAPSPNSLYSLHGPSRLLEQSRILQSPPTKRVKREDQVKRFRCNFGGCGKAFSKSDHLKTHFRTHTKEKPYKCQECSKGFSDLANLKRHTRIHTGDKPFKCETCGKCFAVSSNLKQHRRTHTGDRPYVCHICKKTFSHVSSRRKHMQQHEGDPRSKVEDKVGARAEAGGCQPTSQGSSTATSLPFLYNSVLPTTTAPFYESRDLASFFPGYAPFAQESYTGGAGYARQYVDMMGYMQSTPFSKPSTSSPSTYASSTCTPYPGNPQAASSTGYPRTSSPQAASSTGYPRTSSPQAASSTGYPRTSSPQAASSTGYPYPSAYQIDGNFDSISPSSSVESAVSLEELYSFFGADTGPGLGCKESVKIQPQGLLSVKQEVIHPDDAENEKIERIKEDLRALLHAG